LTCAVAVYHPLLQIVSGVYAPDRNERLSNRSIDSLKPINQQRLVALFLKLKLVEKVAIKMVRSSAHKDESKKPALGSNVEIIIERLADKVILHEIHQSYID
jgi:hypothetical protein